jgi:transcription antitermination protein NusB
MKRFARQKARKLALQAIFQWQFTADAASYIAAQFLDEANVKKIDIAYFSELLKGVIANVTLIDEKITPALDRKITELTPVELAVLRIATFELLNRSDVPYKVVINEALELTKTFGSTDGFKYVNGVLDKLAKTLRSNEKLT